MPKYPDHSTFRDVFLHLRLPFSYFLLPVFVFAVSESGSIHFFNTIIIFISLHFFIYPGSNAYNSYMDKDTGSIGALKNPPPVSKAIYTTSIFLDLIGILMMLLVDWRLMILMIPYTGVSKAYSWTGIRLKKYPVIGWLAVVLFQGGYTFMLVNMTVENNFSASWFMDENIMAMLLSTLLIGAYYPLTQIYQHKEDSERGDFTLSYKLGIRGTFVFSATMFLLSFALAYYYFITYNSVTHFLTFTICLLPAIIYFLSWMFQSWRDSSNADFSHTMRMTFISSTCLLISFSIMLYLNYCFRL